jgi:hypothetical protein
MCKLLGVAFLLALGLVGCTSEKNVVDVSDIEHTSSFPFPPDVDPAAGVAETLDVVCTDAGPATPAVDGGVPDPTPTPSASDDAGATATAVFAAATDIKCTQVGGDGPAMREYKFETTVQGTLVPITGATAAEIVASLCLKEVMMDGKPVKQNPPSLKGCGKDADHGTLGCTSPDWSFTKNISFFLLVDDFKDGDNTLWKITAGSIKVDGKATDIPKSPYPSPTEENAKQKQTVKVTVPSLDDKTVKVLSDALGADDAKFLQGLVKSTRLHEEQHVCQIINFLQNKAQELWNNPTPGKVPDGKKGFASPKDALAATVKAFTDSYNAIRDGLKKDVDTFHAVENAFRNQKGYKKITIGKDVFYCPQLPENYSWLSAEIGKGDDKQKFQADRCGALGVTLPNIDYK